MASCHWGPTQIPLLASAATFHLLGALAAHGSRLAQFPGGTVPGQMGATLLRRLCLPLSPKGSPQTVTD